MKAGVGFLLLRLSPGLQIMNEGALAEFCSSHLPLHLVLWQIKVWELITEITFISAFAAHKAVFQ